MGGWMDSKNSEPGPQPVTSTASIIADNNKPGQHITHHNPVASETRHGSVFHPFPSHPLPTTTKASTTNQARQQKQGHDRDLTKREKGTPQAGSSTVSA